MHFFFLHQCLNIGMVQSHWPTKLADLLSLLLKTKNVVGQVGSHRAIPRCAVEIGPYFVFECTVFATPSLPAKVQK